MPSQRTFHAVERNYDNLIRWNPIEANRRSKVDNVATAKGLKCRRIKRRLIGVL
jgi:hypothetical protein